MVSMETGCVDVKSRLVIVFRFYQWVIAFTMRRVRVQTRIVPGFTVQSLQKNTTVTKPPSANCHRERSIGDTAFRRFYNRGDFPLMVEHGSKGNRLAWKTNFDSLDYQYLLPLFFDGLCETVYPYEFIVKKGIYDLLEHGSSKVLSFLPQLIPPIRKALNTRNRQVIETTLRILQHMVKTVDGFGIKLVSHYKQILPVLNLFKNNHFNCGDEIVYGQLKKVSLGDLIQETLEILEVHGGEEAFYYIKYMIPTYESCVRCNIGGNIPTLSSNRF